MSFNIQDLPEKVQDKIMPEPMSGCWIWIGAKGHWNYGTLFTKKGQMLAHRYTYQFFISNPKGGHVCHHCDNPPCCNPEHLFLGNPRENRLDCLRKGRGVTVGETHYQTKLKIKDVFDIRSSSLSVSELAKKYGYSYGSMWRIVRRKVWNHV